MRSQDKLGIHLGRIDYRVFTSPDSGAMLSLCAAIASRPGPTRLKKGWNNKVIHHNRLLKANSSSNASLGSALAMYWRLRDLGQNSVRARLSVEASSAHLPMPERKQLHSLLCAYDEPPEPSKRIPDDA